MQHKREATPASGIPKPAPALAKFKAEPDKQVTMVDFWIQNGWYKKMKDSSIKLGRADWRGTSSIREEAVRFLVEKVLKKDPRDITQEDFYSNRLGGLLPNYYNGSPYAALKDAGYDFHPWEMCGTPKAFYESKDNRIAAVRWLVDKLKKDPRDITAEDFRSKRLGGLFTEYYHSSPHEALIEAGYEILPWEMVKTPMEVYGSKENRIAAVRWLVDKLKKHPRDITQEDFYSNRLGGLLTHYYSNSPYEAILEAGLVTKAEEASMRKHSPSTSGSK